MNRMAKKRALQRAGLAHVSGWVRCEDEAKVVRLIDKAAPVVAQVSADPQEAAQ